MDNVYQLTQQLENCTHAKVNFEIFEIDYTYVNADLGVYEEVNGVQQFVFKYTSAVIHISNLIGYVQN
jgi:hypothetical protein